MESAGDPTPTLDGPFSSWQEVQNAHSTTIANLITGSKTLENYLKKCPNKSVNMALVYQSFALKCVNFGHHKAKDTGQHATQTCNCCTFVKRY